MTPFFWYLSWIPLTIALYIFQSFLTVKSNLNPKDWHWIFLVVSCFPMWAFISKYSKPENLFYDAMVFDAVLILSYSIGLLYFTGSVSKFSYGQYMGIFLIILGMFVFKKGI